MPHLYSQLRQELHLKVDRTTDAGWANLTHYLQNHPNPASEYFHAGALAFLARLRDKGWLAPKTVDEYLPVQWDVRFPPPANPTFTFIDLFAGIGGIRLAYQRLGGKCVFSSEWNAFAKATYEANFGEVPFGDITSIHEKEIPEHDVLVAGFPCQPFSIAGVTKKTALGKQHGFLDDTQGTLFFDIVRILAEKKPPAFMLENVKNLQTHDRKKTFAVITRKLDELGYSVHFQVLDGQHFVPQHRERIIIVGFRYDLFAGWEQFTFPKLSKSTHRIADILDDEVEDRYTLTDHLWKYLQDYAEKHRAKGNGFGFGLTNLDGIARTLSARYYKDGAEVLIPQVGKNPRRLTPRECARLQGFPDEFQIPVSDTQAYRQFGNSVVVPLIEAVGERLIEVIQAKAYGAVGS